jgi:bacterial/archaeal transporter family protein
MWVTLAFICASLLGTYQIAKKLAVSGNVVISVTLFSTLFATMLAAMALFLSQYSDSTRAPVSDWTLSTSDHVLLIAKAVLVTASWILSFAAIKHLPLSTATPIRESGPVWTLAGAFLIFSERLTFVQWIGAGLLMASFYIFSSASSREGLRFFANRWVLMMFAATLLASCSSLYDKYLLQGVGYPVPVMQFWFYLYNSTLLALVYLAMFRLRGPFEWRFWILGAGALLYAADLFYFLAVSSEGALISVISLMRRGAVLIPFFGGILLFGEQFSRRKLLAVSVLLFGLLLVSLRHIQG